MTKHECCQARGCPNTWQVGLISQLYGYFYCCVGCARGVLPAKSYLTTRQEPIIKRKDKRE